MAFDKTTAGSGALFVNNKKAAETHPDRTGYIEITPEFWGIVKRHIDQAGGMVKLDVSGWIRKPNAGGEPFLSLSVKEPFQKTGGGNKRTATSGAAGGDIPF